jgi:hypothetical protein
MCNVLRCSFIRHYLTTCFGLNDHLQVYRLRPKHVVKQCLIKEQRTILHIDGAETPKSDENFLSNKLTQ